MKIISKENDYYDSIAYSSTPVFVRHEKKVEVVCPEQIKNIVESFPEVIRKYGHDLAVLPGVIFFCGKAYPFIRMEFYKGPTLIQHYAYCMEDLAKIFSVYPKTLKAERARFYGDAGKKRSKFRWMRHHWRNFEHDIVEEMFEFTGRAIDPSLFFEHKTPIVMITPKSNRPEEPNVFLTVSPNLKKRNFQRVIDPYMAYQELEMYLSGVLGNIEKDTVGVDDKHLAAQKGFDKYSFKRLPGKGRPKDPR